VILAVTKRPTQYGEGLRGAPGDRETDREQPPKGAEVKTEDDDRHEDRRYGVERTAQEVLGVPIWVPASFPAARPYKGSDSKTDRRRGEHVGEPEAGSHDASTETKGLQSRGHFKLVDRGRAVLHESRIAHAPSQVVPWTSGSISAVRARRFASGTSIDVTFDTASWSEAWFTRTTLFGICGSFRLARRVLQFSSTVGPRNRSTRCMTNCSSMSSSVRNLNCVQGSGPLLVMLPVTSR